VPGPRPEPFHRWSYPSQIPTGPIETGDSPALPEAGPGFLTLPFFGPHFVTSIFDHCSPNYVPDGRVCRYDGVIKVAAGFGDPLPGGKDYLFYDGHDGIDYGLYNENVAAAADGTVSYAGWDKPGCATCGFGLNVWIDHGNGFLTRYGHLQTLDVDRGERVRRGQVLGLSGSTGASTGEHLHWGVYTAAGRFPVDPYGWTGEGPDAWPHNAGNLWSGGAPRFAALPPPRVAVEAAPAVDGEAAIDVSWSSPGGGAYDVEVLDGDALGSRWLRAVTGARARFSGRPGHAYSFLVTVRNELGWTDTGISGAVRLEEPATP